jgi:hypothetical protein
LQGISAFGALGIGGGIWYLKKVRATTPITCRKMKWKHKLYLDKDSTYIIDNYVTLACTFSMVIGDQCKWFF